VFSPLYMERVSTTYPGIESYLDQLRAQGSFELVRPNLYPRDQVPPKVLSYLDRYKPIFSA
jgi:hypothetical protein